MLFFLVSLFLLAIKYVIKRIAVIDDRESKNTQKNKKEGKMQSKEVMASYTCELWTIGMLTWM